MTQSDCHLLLPPNMVMEEEEIHHVGNANHPYNIHFNMVMSFRAPIILADPICTTK